MTAHFIRWSLTVDDDKLMALADQIRPTFLEYEITERTHEICVAMAVTATLLDEYFSLIGSKHRFALEPQALVKGLTFGVTSAMGQPTIADKFAQRIVAQRASDHRGTVGTTLWEESTDTLWFGLQAMMALNPEVVKEEGPSYLVNSLNARKKFYVTEVSYIDNFGEMWGLRLDKMREYGMSAPTPGPDGRLAGEYA
jgi:hypothetical protein